MPATLTPLRYPGGKSSMIDYVESILALNNLYGCTYFEPFAGGAGLALKLLIAGMVNKLILNDYDKAIYRFADYNSGMYSSRNAAFQKMIEKSSGIDLDLDGDLLSYDKNGNPRAATTTTEKALLNLFVQNNVLITPRQLRNDLEKEKEKGFEKTQTYAAVSKIYTEKTQKDPIYAIMPEVVISGPKLSRDYNTNWYASRVNGRYDTCMQRAKRI